MTSTKENSLWANRKCLTMCAIVSIANIQYGIDTAALGELQTMPGFSKVFGVEDPSSPFGYGIDVSGPPLRTLIKLTVFVADCPTTDDFTC
jgi:hypothetical protein